MLPRLTLIVLLGLAGTLTALAQTDPASLPAHDAHEGLLIAANPLSGDAAYKARFGKKNPYDAGLLAIEVVFRNDNSKPIRIKLESIRLILAPPDVQRQRFGMLSVEDVADRILNKGGPNLNKSRKPIPMPGRGPKTGKGKELDQLESSLRAVAFDTDILPPRGTVRGLLFFDLNHHYDWLRYARLYLPDLEFMDSKQALLFFEIDLSVSQ